MLFKYNYDYDEPTISSKSQLTCYRNTYIHKHEKINHPTCRESYINLHNTNLTKFYTTIVLYTCQYYVHYKIQNKLID